MTRREFLGLIGSAALWRPVAGHAQQATMPLVGFLSSRTPKEAEYLVAAVHAGLGKWGLSREKTLQLNTVMLKVITTGSRRLRLIWLLVGSP